LLNKNNDTFFFERISLKDGRKTIVKQLSKIEGLKHTDTYKLMMKLYIVHVIIMDLLGSPHNSNTPSSDGIFGYKEGVPCF
jgi:hypothetical protein